MKRAHTRSVATVTALLAVLLALGLPATADSGSATGSRSDAATSDVKDRPESEADNDHGYGNDGKAEKADKKSDKSGDSTDPTVTSDPDPAEDTKPVDQDEETTEVVNPADQAGDGTDIDDPGDGTTDQADSAEEEAASEDDVLDDSAEAEGTADKTDEGTPTDVVTLPPADDAGTVDNQVTDDTDPDPGIDPPGLSDGATNPTLDEESPEDHDKGYGNDDKSDKVGDKGKTKDKNEDEGIAAPPAVVPDATPEVIVVLVATPQPESRVRPQAPTPKSPILVTQLQPNNPHPDLSTAAGTNPVASDPTGLAPATLPFDDTTPMALTPATISVAPPVAKGLTPAAGVALVDLLAVTDTNLLEIDGADTVAEAARQAAGLVAVPAAALTTLGILGWAIKPTALKLGALLNAFAR